MTAQPSQDPVPAAELRELLERGRIDVVGRLRAASNVTLLADVTADGVTQRAVYKPVSGERPLWDFPDGTLAGREVAAHLLCDAVGSSVVPVTVLRNDAPFGPGSLQAWADSEADEPGEGLVDIVAPQDLPKGWRSILSATGADGSPVVLAHADLPALREVAVLDVVLNNADRKGGHLLVDTEGIVRGVDHGLTFHGESKLRTVLWGWAGERLTEAEAGLVRRLCLALDGDLGTALADHLTRSEIAATARRAAALARSGRFPRPGGEWPAVPWPAF